MTPIGYVFWTWVAISLVVFVVRRVRSARARRLRRAGAAAAVAEPLGPSAPVHAAPAHAARAEGAPGPLPDMATVKAMQRATLLDALQGISLPCDLVPVVEQTGDVAVARRAVLTTTGHPVAEVREGMAQELVRLGYRLRAVSEERLQASGPRADLKVWIHDDSARVPSAPQHAVVVELELV